MINKKLIHFNTYSAFEANKSQLYDWTIAFIGETKQIYTHGNFYDCDIEDINSLQKTVDLINQNVLLKEGVYIAATDGTLTLPENWISGEKTRVGIAIVSKEHAFIFNDQQQGVSKAWSATNTTDLSDVSNTTDTFDGINNTDTLCSLDNTTTYAAGYARSKSITFGEKTLNGYLGSVGEWNLLNKYRTAFNNALVTVNSSLANTPSSVTYFYMWTSTEYSSNQAYCISSYMRSGFSNISTYRIDKTATQYETSLYPMRIFPFYELDIPLKFQVSELQSLIEELKSIKADKSEIPTKVSQLENDSDYVTESELTAKGYTTNTGTVTSVTAGTGLTGGTISTSGTIALGNSGATAGSYGPSADVNGSNGTTMSVPYITVDQYGRVTSVSNKTYTSVDTTYPAMTASVATTGTNTSARTISAKVLHDKIVDTAVVNDGNILNIAKVSSLPSSPNANTLYVIV